MTPNEHLNKLRQDYLKDIKLFFEENNLKEIEFKPIPNELGIEPYTLNDDGILSLVDENGNDSDYVLRDMSIEIVAHILTLIQTSAYDTTD